MHLVMWWIMDDPYTKIQLLSYYGLSVACIIPLFELIIIFFYNSQWIVSISKWKTRSKLEEKYTPF